MKKKDLTEIKLKQTKDILAKVRDLEKEKVNFQIELAMGKTKNVHGVAGIKKTIAQTLTIARQKLILEADKAVRKPKEAENGSN
jgi:ribosomal protein L29